MKPTKISFATTSLACLAILLFCVPAWASEADTTATVSGGRGRSGSAAATTHYEGDAGFARTDTRTGRVNLARGVAVGVDEDGISLSFSLAIAPLNGPAFATNFNLSFERDGDVATSFGNVLASGGTSRTVSVGGGSSTTPYGANATSMASGKTTHGGIVRATTHSNDYKPREVRPRRIVVLR